MDAMVRRAKISRKLCFSKSNVLTMNIETLFRCKKKKQELQNALKFSARLSDGGDILRYVRL